MRWVCFVAFAFAFAIFIGKMFAFLNSENKDVDKAARERETTFNLLTVNFKAKCWCVCMCVCYSFTSLFLFQISYSFHDMEIIVHCFRDRNREKNIAFFFKIHGRCNTQLALAVWTTQLARVLFSATNGDSYQTMQWFLQNQSNKCILCMWLVPPVQYNTTQCEHTCMYAWIYISITWCTCVFD